jgi:hypothetical protein
VCVALGLCTPFELVEQGLSGCCSGKLFVCTRRCHSDCCSLSNRWHIIVYGFGELVQWMISGKLLPKQTNSGYDCANVVWLAAVCMVTSKYPLARLYVLSSILLIHNSISLAPDSLANHHSCQQAIQAKTSTQMTNRRG